MADHAAAERKPGALPAPPGAAERRSRSLRHLLLEQRAGGPQPVQRPVVGTDPVQLKLNRKGGKYGEKIDGDIKSVTTEVVATIGRNKLGEMLDDIAALQTSIASREAEQGEFDSSTQEYKDHQYRIAVEKQELAKLVKAYDAEKAKKDATKPPKPKPDADGWTEVKSKK